MGASVTFSESNGAGEVVTNGISNVNMGDTDAPNLVPASNFIFTGENSFAKYIRAKIGGTGWTEVFNMKFWKSSGTYVSGEWVAASANTTYATPSQIYTGDSIIPTTAGTALSVLSYEGEVGIENGISGVSGYSGYIRLQEITTVASGHMNQKIFTFQWDEY